MYQADDERSLQAVGLAIAIEVVGVLTEHGL